MSELIDRSVLKARMYSEAFESDTDMQKWDSGCWIRYKLFEKVVDNMPTVPYSTRWHRVEEPPKWVSVFDDLPRHNAVVVVSDGKRSWDVGQYHFLFKADDRTIWWWKKHTTRKVLWWMYKEDAIPEPPKEDEHGN